MPNKSENLLLHNKKELFQFLNSRFEKNVKMFDEGGQQVTDYNKVADFIVPFSDMHGHKVDVINITLEPDVENDNEEKYIIKMMFTKDMLNSGHLVNNKFDKFEKDLIAWSKSRMIDFKPVPVDVVVKRHKTMYESKFGPLSGTVKTSTQTLENAKLIIKHTDTIDENIRGSRTRKIHKIYVENSNGEKFLLPYKNMRGARAMARHVNFGGNPYDKAGQSISNFVSEAIALSKFVRKTRNKNFDQMATEMVEAAQIRLTEVKKQLSRLCSERGYTKYKEELVEQQEIEFNEDIKSHFIQNKYDEALDECLPFVWGAYKKMSEMKEIKEFKNWVEEAVDPRLDQAVKQATNSKTPPVSVVTDPDGTQELQANPADPKTNDALKQISKNMGGKLPPVSIKKVTEDGMTQFTVTFTKPGKKLVKTINAASKESAEIEAYNMADKNGWGIRGEVVPVQETLGGDKADDFVDSVRDKDQPIVEDDELHIDQDDQEGEMSLGGMCKECGVYFGQDDSSEKSMSDPSKCKDCAGECEAERNAEREAGVKYEYTDKVGGDKCIECGAFFDADHDPSESFYAKRSDEDPDNKCKDCAGETEYGGEEYPHTEEDTNNLFNEEFSRMKFLLKY